MKWWTIALIAYLIIAVIKFFWWGIRLRIRPWDAAAVDHKISSRFFSALLWPIRTVINITMNYQFVRAQKQTKNNNLKTSREEPSVSQERSNAIDELIIMNKKYGILSSKVEKDYKDLLNDTSYMREQEEQAKKDGFDSFCPEIWLFYVLSQKIVDAIYEKKTTDMKYSEAFRYCQNKLVEYGYSHTGTKWTETIATAEANKLEAQIIESNLGLW